MLFRSNLKGVIRNLEDYQDGLPAAVQRAIVPDKRWRNVLANAATHVLSGLAAGEEDERALELTALIPDIVATLTGAIVADRTQWRMWLAAATAAGAGFPVDVERARRFALTGGGDEGGQFVSPQQNLDAVKEAVRQWVYEEKRLDEYEHADPDAAVDAMMEILGFQPNRQNVYTPAMAAAAGEIAPHVQAFIQAQGAGTGGGLDRKTALQWAQAVLITWRAVVPDELFHRLRRELNALRRQVLRGELKLA